MSIICYSGPYRITERLLVACEITTGDPRIVVLEMEGEHSTFCQETGLSEWGVEWEDMLPAPPGSGLYVFEGWWWSGDDESDCGFDGRYRTLAGWEWGTLMRGEKILNLNAPSPGHEDPK